MNLHPPCVELSHLGQSHLEGTDGALTPLDPGLGTPQSWAPVLASQKAQLSDLGVIAPCPMPHAPCQEVIGPLMSTQGSLGPHR